MKLATLSKPADFPLAITVQELDGSEVQIPFTCIGRTTLDWQPIALARLEKDANALIDQEEKLQAEQEKTAAAAPEDKPKKRQRIKIPHAEIAKTTEKGLAEAVAMVREVAGGWGLEIEFSDENIRKAIALYPGVQAKLWQEYDARIKGNRAKN